MILDIEIFEGYGEGHGPQAKYLVHGHDDVYWTDDLHDAVDYLKGSLLELEKEE